MKKRLLAAIPAVFMVLTLFSTAFAANTESVVIDMGDGFYAVSTVTYYQSNERSNTFYGERTDKVYNGNTQIGAATIYGKFSLSGSTVRATSGSMEGSGMNGWSYQSGTASCSGNKVSGTAKFKSGSTTKSLPMTLTGYSDGTVS